MTAPGTLLMAKMLVPETEQPLTAGRVEMPATERESNVLGAIARGTVDGLHLALNVGAMLIVFLALLAFVNACMGWIHLHVGWFPYNLQLVLGWMFSPVAWLIGIPWHDARRDRKFARNAHGAERIRGVRATGPDQRLRSIRAASRSRRSRFADSRISARSGFRSAASERWRRSSAASWRNSASGRCWRGRWRI